MKIIAKIANDRKPLNSNGLSLIEIVVSLSILSTVFISLLGSFPIGLGITKDAEFHTISSHLAQNKIEELIAAGYNSIPTGTIEPKARLSNDINDYFYYFQRQTNVNYVDANLANSLVETNLKKITTTVFYINKINKTEKSYILTALISNN